MKYSVGDKLILSEELHGDKGEEFTITAALPKASGDVKPCTLYILKSENGEERKISESLI